MLGRFLDESFAPEVRTDVTTLTVTRLTANACYRFSAPFLATIARGLDVSLEQVGVALAIAELSGLLSPLTGRVVDRNGHRRAMIAGLLGMACGTALAACSQGVPMFAVALVVLSQSKVVFDIGLGSWIATHVPYERRGVVVGITETSWALGLLVGVSLMGLVTAFTNWRGGYVLACAGVLTMATIVASRVARDQHVVPTHPVVSGHPSRSGLDRAGWLAAGGAFCLMASSQCLALSAVTFALGLGELTSSITSARRTDRWGKERSIALGAGLMVPSAAGLALWHDSLAAGLVLLVIVVAGFEFAIVSSLALASSLVPGSPARGLGVMIAAGTLGRAVASVPATRLYEDGGLGWPAVMSAALASGTVIAMYARSRARTLVV
ncbi:MAG: MFS transporter [Actinobacteria bacterium]|nr:MFS transporter [Actinomycetota bacterium]